MNNDAAMARTQVEQTGANQRTAATNATSVNVANIQQAGSGERNQADITSKEKIAQLQRDQNTLLDIIKTNTNVFTGQVNRAGIAAGLRGIGREDLAKGFEDPAPQPAPAAKPPQPTPLPIGSTAPGTSSLDPGAYQAPTSGTDAGPGGRPQVYTPRSKADLDALPSGALYVNPTDGGTYRKK